MISKTKNVTIETKTNKNIILKLILNLFVLNQLLKNIFKDFKSH